MRAMSSSPCRGVAPDCGSDGEGHTLRERQLAGVVDRVGRAAHVALPRVGAGLASPTGLLLAAERAADLGARRPDVDIGDAAVRAVGGEEALRLALVAGEDARRQPLRDGV